MISAEQKRSRTNRFPPGPFAWPVIGHLHLLSHLPHQALRDLSKRYGPILGLRLGQQLAVVVSSPELAKQVLHTHDKIFANRPPYQLNELLLYGQNSDIIFSAQCPQWRKQRKICTVGLFTAKRLQELEHIRQEEVGTLLRRLQEESAGATRPVEIGRSVSQMSAHVVMRLLQSAGSMHAGSENLVELVKELEHEVSSPTLGDVIPALSWLDFPRTRRMRRLHSRADAALSAVIAERRSKQQAATWPTSYEDLLQSLLSKLEDVDPSCNIKTSSSLSAIPLQDTLTLDEIKCIMLDMLAAGIHTTALTVEWAMAELLRNPHCLETLRKEMENTLGRESNVMICKKLITDADIAKLSYLKCIVKEVLRLHPAIPMLLPRFSTEECEIEGYMIPARTLMLVNVWAIGRDTRVWGADAEEFRPERYLGDQVQEKEVVDVRGQHFELLPFGSGRRICVGMPLGLSIVQVTLANLVNQFEWELPFGQMPSSMDMHEKNGITTNKATPTMAIPRPRSI